jgi:hypothetical protein
MLQALDANGSLFEMYADQDGENWTATITTPLNNVACVMGTGTFIYATEHPAAVENDSDPM